MDKAYDINKILSLLPHRYPIILVDRVILLKPDIEIKALKNVTMNEPYFQGHFPNLPIMPGVLIVEALAQTGSILIEESLPPEKKGRIIYFAGMDKVRFRKKVIPGDSLILELKITNKKRNIVKMSALAKVDKEIVCDANLTAAIGDKNDT
jgi:beta-hydroxyacyl-ACP dehydratase FabZ